MAASNFWDCMTKPGEVDFRIFTTSYLWLRPHGGAVPMIPIRAGEDVSTIPMVLLILHGVLPLTHVLLTCRRVMWIHAPPDVASATTYFVKGIRSVCGVNLIAAIPGFICRVKTGMVWQLNNSCSQILLLVFRIACKVALCVTRGRCVWLIKFGVIDCQILYWIY